MRYDTKRQRNGRWLIGAVLALGGCASPPSVVPLLQAAQRAMTDEAAQVKAGAQRDQAWIAQSREALKQGYDADLKAQDKLSVAWIQQATAGYVAAREALTQQAMKLAEQRQQRLDNLNAATQAQQQAVQLLQQRDQLMAGLWPGKLASLRSLLQIQTTAAESK